MTGKPAQRRYREARPTYLWWWLMWLVILCWPLLLPEPAGGIVEGIWLVPCAAAAWLACSGRRGRGQHR